MKTKIKILLGTIFIFLCLLNINVITNRDNELRLSLSSITRSALADSEGEPLYYTWACRICPLPYNEYGVEYWCPLVTYPDECFTTGCYYGVC